MKKKIIIILIIILVIVAVVIGIVLLNKNKGLAEIKNRNGENVKLTTKELKEIYNNNPAVFKNYYYGAEILVTGTISDIEYDFLEDYGSGRIILDAITLKEGYKVSLLHDAIDMTKFNKGDKVIISSNIYFVSGDIELRGTSGGAGYNETTLKSTIVENITGKSEDEINAIKESILVKKEIHSSLEVLDYELDFISKFAGNINSNGSRKFANERLNSFNACLTKDYNFNKLSNDDIKSKMENIINQSKEVYDMIVDMGDTNSDKNVSTIKTNAKSILSNVKALSKEIYE